MPAAPAVPDVANIAAPSRPALPMRRRTTFSVLFMAPPSGSVRNRTGTEAGRTDAAWLGGAGARDPLAVRGREAFIALAPVRGKLSFLTEPGPGRRRRRAYWQ